MRRAAAAAALLALMAPHESATKAQGAEREIVLTLPRSVAAGEAASIEVQVGAVGSGQIIEVATAAGRPLGFISPFGRRVGQDAGNYTVPIPANAIRDGRIAIRLTIRQGDAARPPTTEEVRGIKLSIVGRAR